MKLADFINIWLNKTVHDLELRAVPSSARIFTRKMEDIQRFMAKHINENLYFGVYTRQGGGKKENIREATCLFADMDFKGYVGGEAEAKKILKSFKPEPSLLVHSGNGYHCYWLLETPLPHAYSQIQEVEAVLRGLAIVLKADIVVAEIARILRLPESYNQKNIPPRKVEIINYNPVFYDFDDFKQFKGKEEPKIDAPVNTNIDALVEKCTFIKHCRDNGATLSEPLWYAMLSNVVRLVNGVSIAHQLSRIFPKYSKKETDQKILQAMNASAPTSCRKIKELMTTFTGHDCGKIDCGYISPAGVFTGKKTLKTEVLEKGKKQVQTFSVRDILQSTMSYIETRVNNPGVLSGIRSGFQALDDITDGFQPGNLILIPARPSTGKSAWMLNVIQSAAQDVPVGVISLEMTDIDNGLRLLAANTGIHINKIRKGFLGEKDFASLVRASETLAQLPIFWQFGQNTEKALEKSVQGLVEKEGCRMIFIDHMHLMRTEGKSQNREREIAVLSQTGKNLAMQYKIPMVFLCQLNRESEKANRKPVLSDLRDSGSLEQDADLIIFLHQIDKENKTAIEMIIAKGRNVGTGSILMEYEGDITKFSIPGEKIQPIQKQCHYTAKEDTQDDFWTE